MRNTITLIVMLSMQVTASAQVYGNGKVITKSYAISQIENILVNFYADITIDPSIEEGITITAEENIIDLIDLDVTQATLDIGQKEWIEANKRITIVIGAPNLRSVEMDTNDKVDIKNINQQQLVLKPSLGTIIASGKVNQLRVIGTDGDLEATRLTTEDATVNVDGRGKVVLSVSGTLNSTVEGKGSVKSVTTPTKVEGNTKSVDNKPTERNRNYTFTDDEHQGADFIKFDLNNNSWGRKNFVVIGPKKNGHTFSYGFSLLPGQTKAKDWSVGSRIYREGTFGKLTYLTTITARDSGKTVKIFK